MCSDLTVVCIALNVHCMADCKVVDGETTAMHMIIKAQQSGKPAGEDLRASTRPTANI